MANVLRLICALIFSVVLALTGVHLGGGSQSSYVAVLFTNPDGTSCSRPCLVGVRPGVTSYLEAIRILRTHPVTHDFEPNIDRGVFSGQSISVIVFLDKDDLVSRIDLLRTPTAQLSWGTLGEVVAFLGAPDMVGVDTESTRSYYLSQSMMFFHSHTVHDRVTVNEQFDDLLVFGHQVDASSDAELAPWLGFSRISRYREKR